MPPKERLNGPTQQQGWRRIDGGALGQLHAVLRSDAMAPACLRAIENRLLSSGILFTSLDYSTRASEGFQTHINTHFARFVRDALRETIVCGWCFFTIDNDIPRVVPSSLADVRWRVVPDTFRIEIAVFKPGEEKPAKNIFSVIDQCVDSYGNIQSTVSEYMRTRSLYEAFMRNTLQADRINAVPPIYTMTQTDQVFDERDITNTGDLEDLRPAQVGTELNTRARLNINTHRFNESIVRQLNSRSAESIRREKTDAASGLAHFDAGHEDLQQTVVPLPLDARVAPVPRPTSRADIVNLMKHFETLACVAFGVNSESVGADRSGGHLGAQAIERVNLVTAETTQKWARLFEPALVKIFTLIWGVDEDITVVFPSTLPSSTIDRLYASRVLSHKAYIGYISQTVQLPSSAFEEEDHRMLGQKQLTASAPKTT